MKSLGVKVEVLCERQNADAQVKRWNILKVLNLVDIS